LSHGNKDGKIFTEQLLNAALDPRDAEEEDFVHFLGEELLNTVNSLLVLNKSLKICFMGVIYIFYGSREFKM
jgi:hypothetical protein